MTTSEVRAVSAGMTTSEVRAAAAGMTTSEERAAAAPWILRLYTATKLFTKYY
jgi:hypothetical protein